MKIKIWQKDNITTYVDNLYGSVDLFGMYIPIFFSVPYLYKVLLFLPVTMGTTSSAERKIWTSLQRRRKHEAIQSWGGPIAIISKSCLLYFDESNTWCIITWISYHYDQSLLLISCRYKLYLEKKINCQSMCITKIFCK